MLKYGLFCFRKGSWTLCGEYSDLRSAKRDMARQSYPGQYEVRELVASLNIKTKEIAYND